MSDSDACAKDGRYNGSLGLRIGSIFVILVTSLFGTLFPVVTKRIPSLNVPSFIYDITRYFGSGVILATAFMHLLEPAADDELGSECVNSTFQGYPFAFLFCLLSSLVTFALEMIAYRVGSKLAAKLAYDPHGENAGNHHHPAVPGVPDSERDTTVEFGDVKGDKASSSEEENWAATTHADDGTISANPEAGSAASQIMGVLVLEFGVIFHSVIIGLTLGSQSDQHQFKILFIVIIFHQMFEGLGLGTRLAFLPLAPKSPIPYFGAIAYSVVTPIGEAIGIGIRNTYNGKSATADYVTGTLDAVSAGILAYTAFVELIAHDFVFNEKMRKAPLWYLCLNIFYVFVGAGLMALLAKWA